ncbi:hypothetical protein CFP71_14695 [Amycolatopsis thailandensis]|uniref:Uncharacterized protein n=1 Tax=Amycolatopsis thailandensis TaxID=589330 RepID=A0A229SBK5_9PSEU|nr:hypothetical protein CFP71_14695 [Amycolatopsis thailandensis]
MRRPASAHVETVRYPEIDGVRPDAETEGRVGVVADLELRIQAHGWPAARTAPSVSPTSRSAQPTANWTPSRHDMSVTSVGHPRRTTHPGFDLGGPTLTLVPASSLTALFPGERAPALPALVACTVGVQDLDSTKNLLRNKEIP